MQPISSNINIVLKLCNFNSFLPYFDEKTQEFKTRRLYHATTLTIYFVAYVYMFYVTITLEGALFPERGTLLIIISGTLAIIGACWLLTITRKNRVSNMQKYFDNFEDFDRSLSAIFRTKIKQVKYANSYSLIVLVVYLISILIAYHLWSRDTGSIEYKLHFIGDVFIIMGNTGIILIEVYTLECIKRRYAVLAGIIGSLGLDQEKVEVTNYRIECISRLHNILSDLVMLFNELFSWHILGIILYTVIVDLMTLGYFVTGYYKEDIKVFICIVEWTFLITILVIVIAIMCERVVDEGKKSTAITYKTMSRLSGTVSLRTKMIILGSQMEARCPKFTAAGFFNVDFAMLFTFINLMVTYIIVIIQFSNNI